VFAGKEVTFNAEYSGFSVLPRRRGVKMASYRPSLAEFLAECRAQFGYLAHSHGFTEQPPGSPFQVIYVHRSGLRIHVDGIMSGYGIEVSIGPADTELFPLSWLLKARDPAGSRQCREAVGQIEQLRASAFALREHAPDVLQGEVGGLSPFLARSAEMRAGRLEHLADVTLVFIKDSMLRVRDVVQGVLADLRVAGKMLAAEPAPSTRHAAVIEELRELSRRFPRNGFFSEQSSLLREPDREHALAVARGVEEFAEEMSRALDRQALQDESALLVRCAQDVLEAIDGFLWLDAALGSVDSQLA
jgi:hypothetical protein